MLNHDVDDLHATVRIVNPMCKDRGDLGLVIGERRGRLVLDKEPYGVDLYGGERVLSVNSVEVVERRECLETKRLFDDSEVWVERNRVRIPTGFPHDQFGKCQLYVLQYTHANCWVELEEEGITLAPNFENPAWLVSMMRYNAVAMEKLSIGCYTNKR